MAEKRIKYTLSLSKVMDDHVNRLAKEEDISRPRVFTNALAMYIYIKKEIENGGKVEVVDFAGNVKEIVFQ
jgi:hypothetical protein